jgi:hypothetical protein
VWLLMQSESLALEKGLYWHDRKILGGQYRTLDFDNFFTSLSHLERLKVGRKKTLA